MSPIWLLVGITAIAGVGGTGMGGVVACLFRKDSDKTVSLLLSFAAGVMTAVVCFDLLTEALHTDGTASTVWLVIGGVTVGFALIALLNAWIDKATNHEVAHIDENHPRTADSLEELTHANHLQEHMEGRQPRSGLFLAGLVMAAAIALHNVPEGMVIGASFAITADEILSNRGGLIMALVISLSFASGAMLYVVFGELLPESILMWKSKLPAALAVLGLLTGLIIIYL